MIFAFLSRRFRAWVLAAVLAPIAGRLLRGIGARFQARRPGSRIGRGMVKTGNLIDLRTSRAQAEALEAAEAARQETTGRRRRGRRGR